MAEGDSICVRPRLQDNGHKVSTTPTVLFSGGSL